MMASDTKAVENILVHCDTLSRLKARVKTFRHFLFDDDAINEAVDCVGQIMNLAGENLSLGFKKSCPKCKGNGIYYMQDHLDLRCRDLDLHMLWDAIADDMPEIASMLRGELAKCTTSNDVKPLNF